jgi:hypothetical protein
MKDETYEEFRVSAAAYAKMHPFSRMPLRPLGGEREDCHPGLQDDGLQRLDSDTTHAEIQTSDRSSSPSKRDGAVGRGACEANPPNFDD